MNQALNNLKLAADLVEKAKQVIGVHVEVARVLLTEKQLHELQDISVKVSSDMSTIESDLSEFARIGVKADKFAVAKK